MNETSNGSGKRERRHFTGQQKVAIVKQHLVDGLAVSDLCDKHQILPTQFYQWQKQLFENGDAAFQRKGKTAGKSAQDRSNSRWWVKRAVSWSNYSGFRF